MDFSIDFNSLTKSFFFGVLRCATEPHVLAMHQEKVIHIPGCPEDTDLCSLATFKKIFEESLYQCNFDDFCENPKTTTT